MNSPKYEQLRRQRIEDRREFVDPSGKAWPRPYSHADSYTSLSPHNQRDIEARIALRAIQLQQFNGGLCPKCGKPWDSHCSRSLYVPCGWYPYTPDPDAPKRYNLTKARDYGSIVCQHPEGCQYIIEHRKSPSHVLCPAHQEEHRKDQKKYRRTYGKTLP